MGQFIGTGWAFPPAFTDGGADVVLVQEDQDIFESLQIMLATGMGERVMREDYGCNLRDYLFEELDQRLLNHLRLAVADSIRRHETRIELEDIGFDVQADLQQSIVHIRISFRVRATNSRYNMVYPFYLTESALGPTQAPAARDLRRVAEIPDYSDNATVTTTNNNGDGDGDGEDIGTENPVVFSAFLHRPTAESTGNWSRNYSILDHAQLNGKQDAILFVTPLWGIENEGAPTLDAVEVGYLENEQCWAIYSKNPAVRMQFTNGTPYFFYVLIAPVAAVQQKNAFVHRATPANIRNNMTVLDTDGWSYNNPNAYLLVTPRKSANTRHETGVAYHADSFDRWAIYNAVSDGGASFEPANAMAVGSEFNVLVLPTGVLGNLRAFSHQINSNNIVGSGSWLDHEMVNGKQHILLFFTLAWRPEYANPSGAHCPYHCQWWFDSLTDVHKIYKNDHWLIWMPNATPPAGTVFNIFAIIE